MTIRGASVVRRGFSYGPPLAGSVDDGRDRGLVGIFACARINEQLHDYSLDAGNRLQRSLLLCETGLAAPGQHVRAVRQAEGVRLGHIPLTDGTALDLPLRDFIRYKGLSLFFAPSLASLKILAGGDPRPA